MARTAGADHIPQAARGGVAPSHGPLAGAHHRAAPPEAEPRRRPRRPHPGRVPRSAIRAGGRLRNRRPYDRRPPAPAVPVDRGRPSRRRIRYVPRLYDAEPLAAAADLPAAPPDRALAGRGYGLADPRGRIRDEP